MLLAENRKNEVNWLSQKAKAVLVEDHQFASVEKIPRDLELTLLDAELELMDFFYEFYIHYIDLAADCKDEGPACMCECFVVEDGTEHRCERKFKHIISDLQCMLDVCFDTIAEESRIKVLNIFKDYIFDADEFDNVLKAHMNIIKEEDTQMSEYNKVFEEMLEAQVKEELEQEGILEKELVLKEEKGFTTIEVLILLALLVVLAGFFKEQIFAFAQTLFDQIFTFDASMTW